MRERRRVYQRWRMVWFGGGGRLVSAVAAEMAAARKWKVERRWEGVPVGLGAERNGPGKVWRGRGWKLVGWRRKLRS
jgi:hypothetical protein